MPNKPNIITVTLNTAIDRVLSAAHFKVGAHVRAAELFRYPAGKGINVSRTLARLGWQNIATGFIGEQHAPDYDAFLREIKPGRIINQLLSVKGATRENITILDPANHTDTHIRAEGYAISEHARGRIFSKVGLLARQNTYIVFTGSLPPGMDLTDYNTLVNVALSAGANIILDLDGSALRSIIQFNPDNLNSQTAPVAAKPFFLVKPNESELAEMVGCAGFDNEQQLLDAARLLALQAQWVVVTRADRGAILIAPDGSALSACCDIDPALIINTVGCGDTVLAGLLDALLQSFAPEQAFIKALALATANAAHQGVAEYELGKIAEFEKHVAISPI